MKRTLGVLAVALAAAVGIDSQAQGMPRRDRGGGPRDGVERDAARKTPTVAALEPFAALERELPSLKFDLMLKEAQLEDWRGFERAVRDLAELGRVRRRSLMSLYDQPDKPPAAPELIGSLVEAERVRFEAAVQMKRHLDALYATLEEPQRRMLDRRIVQSQTEPLGTGRP